MKSLFAALALATPALIAAAPAPVTVPASDAERLTALMVPERAMIDLVMTAARNEAQRNPQFGNDQALIDFVIARMKPEMEKVVRDALPELRADLARIIAAEMTPAEVTQVYTFFASPVGQKLQATTFQVIAENPGASPAEQQRIAVERFMAELKPADYPALTAFGGSAGARKMPQVTPRISAASAAWAERLLARHGDRMTALRTQAVADYKRQKAGQ